MYAYFSFTIISFSNRILLVHPKRLLLFCTVCFVFKLFCCYIQLRKLYNNIEKKIGLFFVTQHQLHVSSSSFNLYIFEKRQIIRMQSGESCNFQGDKFVWNIYIIVSDQAALIECKRFSLRLGIDFDFWSKFITLYGLIINHTIL